MNFLYSKRTNRGNSDFFYRLPLAILQTVSQSVEDKQIPKETATKITDEIDVDNMVNSKYKSYIDKKPQEPIPAQTTGGAKNFSFGKVRGRNKI